MKTRHIKIAFTALFMSAALPAVAYAPIAKKSAIIVFTGNEDRVEKGLRLYMAGMADKLFITGIEEQRSALQLLREFDIPQTRMLDGIEFDRIARDTIENARNAQTWMKKAQISDVILVTSEFHMNRSLSLLTRETRGQTNIATCAIEQPVTQQMASAESLKYWVSANVPALFVPESRDTRAAISAFLTKVSNAAHFKSSQHSRLPC
jgi:DUF218 domain-containing protein